MLLNCNCFLNLIEIVNQCRIDKNLNVHGTFRLVENCTDLSFLIRVNPRFLHPRHPRTILFSQAKRR